MNHNHFVGSSIELIIRLDQLRYISWLLTLFKSTHCGTLGLGCVIQTVLLTVAGAGCGIFVTGTELYIRVWLFIWSR